MEIIEVIVAMVETRMVQGRIRGLLLVGIWRHRLVAAIGAILIVTPIEVIFRALHKQLQIEMHHQVVGKLQRIEEMHLLWQVVWQVDVAAHEEVEQQPALPLQEKELHVLELPVQVLQM